MKTNWEELEKSKLIYLNIIFLIAFIISMVIAMIGMFIDMTTMHTIIIESIVVPVILSCLGFWTLEAKWIFGNSKQIREHKHEKEIIELQNKKK